MTHTDDPRGGLDVKTYDIKDPETKKSTGGFLAVWAGAMAAQGGGLSPSAMYSSVAYVRRAVKARSGRVAGIPFIIRNRRGGVVYDSTIGEAPEGFNWFLKIPHLLRLTEASLALEARAAIEIAKCGMPWRKFSVPSSCTKRSWRFRR